MSRYSHREARLGAGSDGEGNRGGATVDKASRGAVALGIALSLAALLFWLLALSTLSDLNGSDAAGNGLAQAYGAVEIAVLWALLAVLAIVTVVTGAVPGPAALAALILIPASGIAAMFALGLLARPDMAPFLWPIIVPALVPPLIAGFCFWALLPSLRAAIPAALAAGFSFGATLVLTASIWPMSEMRRAAEEKDIAVAEKYDADLTALPADAPLWAWTPFLATRNGVKVSGLLDRVRRLDRRQGEAELMLDRGDFPLGFLGMFDLTPTPALCDKARSLLRSRVAPMVLERANAKPYAEIAVPVADAVAAMSWLVGYGCSCDVESLAWERMAKGYRDTNFDVVLLAELRDPKELGRVLRESPARFSMLTPAAHLKAWLSFAGDEGLREQALAGARQLDHRTADALDMLRAGEHGGAWTVLNYLPALDLAATPTLCDAALRLLRDQYAKVYRPRPDDPRQYRELLGRLGGSEPFSDLIWLAQHGCDADAAVSDAEAMVRAYQDSPQRAAVLTTLAQLHAKP
jgi:hypothetical protein